MYVVERHSIDLCRAAECAAFPYFLRSECAAFPYFFSGVELQRHFHIFSLSLVLSQFFLHVISRPWHRKSVPVPIFYARGIEIDVISFSGLVSVVSRFPPLHSEEQNAIAPRLRQIPHLDKVPNAPKSRTAPETLNI
jgi:hypothetical protein